MSRVLESEATQVVRVVLPSFPGYRVTRVLGRGGFGVVYAAEPVMGGPRRRSRSLGRIGPTPRGASSPRRRR